MSFFTKLSNIKKLVVYIASALVEALNESGLVPPRYVHYVQLSVFFLTSVGIYAARNQKPTAATAVTAAAEDAATVASGHLPTLDELEQHLADLKADIAADDAPKHAAPADPADIGPVTQPLPAVPA